MSSASSARFDDGQVLDLGGLKQRALPAVHLLRANEVVPTDPRIDALWPERSPETAAKGAEGRCRAP